MNKLSIIIPIYNVESYIQRCLESIIGQKTDSFNTECIIVDDCSPDNSMNIANNIISSYKGSIVFKILRHNKNMGLSEARNSGLKIASGDSILFIDSDDYLMPNALSCMMEAKANYPDVDIIIGNVYEHKYKKNQYKLKEQQLITGGTEVRRWMLTNEFAISAWNKIFSRDLLIENQLFFEPGILYEDIPWTHKLYTKISSILLLPNVTYGYWYNENSISSSSQPSDKSVRSFVIGCQSLVDTLYESPLYVPQKLFIFRWVLNAINAKSRCTSKEILDSLYRIRSKFMFSTLSDYRIILAIFFLLMYNPFNQVFRIRYFRRYYNQLSRLVGHIAYCFDFLH